MRRRGERSGEAVLFISAAGIRLARERSRQPADGRFSGSVRLATPLAGKVAPLAEPPLPPAFGSYVVPGRFTTLGNRQTPETRADNITP